MDRLTLTLHLAIAKAQLSHARCDCRHVSCAGRYRDQREPDFDRLIELFEKPRKKR